MPPQVDVVHIGSASRDVTDADPRGWRLGGGVTYGALTSARLGLRTAALVGVDALAAEADELDDLRAAGVDVQLLPIPEGPVFINEETTAGRIQTCVRAGVALSLPEIPAAWMTATGWSLVPVAAELGDAWATLVPARAHLTVAWQGSLRTLVSGQRVLRRPPRPSASLDRADLVGVSRHDLATNTRLRDLWRSIRAGADLLVTEGTDGGRLFHMGPEGPASTLRYRALRTTHEVDPTGAGDVFLAALQATILRPTITGRTEVDRRLDLAFAASAASLVVEGPGMASVPTADQVRARLASWTDERPGTFPRD